VLLTLVLAANAGAEIRTIAVIDFTDQTGKNLGLGPVASEILGAELVKSGRFVLVERARLKRILDEYALSMSGLVDSEQNMLKVGKLLSADAIITGAVIEFSEKRQQTTAYGITTTRLTYNLEVTVKKFEVATSRIVFADIFSASQEVLQTGGSQSTTDDVDRQLLRKALAKALDALVAMEKPPVQPLAVDYQLQVMVAFNSNPPGAEVVVDGISCGFTPISIPLTEGMHTVRISKDGYTVSEYRFNVTKGMGAFSVTLVQ